MASFLTFGGRLSKFGRFFLCWKDEKPGSFCELRVVTELKETR